ncbi:MAG: hypothetical protein ABEJ73_00380 [Haloplanus sp.]
MPGDTFLLVTVVTGLVVVGAGLLVARLRRSEHPARRSSSRRALTLSGAGTTGVHPDTPAVGVVTLAVVVAAVAIVTGPRAVVFAALPALLLAFFTWGIYSLARSRGLPRAHSVGLSAWLFGVVLIGVVVVKLLVG